MGKASESVASSDRRLDHPVRLALAVVASSLAVGCVSSAPPSGGSGAETALFRPTGSTPTYHEARVNTFTHSTQENAAVALYPDGGSVVVWDSRRQERGTYGVYLQRFDAAGAPVGGETHVNVHTDSMQMRPAVAVDGRGGTWVAWESFGQDGALGAIVARRFAKGFGAAGNEILVNRKHAGQQADVVVAAHENGDATFFWTTPGDEGVRRRVVGRRLDRHGDAMTDEFDVGQSGAAWENLPTVTTDGRGRTLVVWAVADADGVPAGIRGRIYGAAGAPLTDEIAISDPGLHIEPAVAASADGFAVAWLSAQHDDYSVLMRRFDVAGAPVGPARSVEDPGVRKHLSGVALTALPGGRLALSWNARDAAAFHDDLFLQIIESDDRRPDAPVRVNRHVAGHQRLWIASGKQRMAAGSDGRLAFAWSGESADDKTSVNLLMRVPGDVSYRLETPAASADASAEAFAAKPHEPPIYDPDTIPTEPHGGDRSPYAGDGADFGFIGVTNSGWTPPDPHIAVGPEHIVVMTNGEIAFFEKDGTRTFVDEIENSFGFWGALGADNFVFDPEVIFDPHTNRFMAMACERSDNGRSNYLLAVSDDADPNGSWNKYRLDVTALAGNDIDSPNIGVDDEVVYLTSDHFGPSKYLIFMLDKSDLLVGNPPDTTSMLVVGEHSFGIPVNYDAGAPAQYMIQAFEFGTYDEIQLHAITDPLGTPQRVTTLVTVPSYSHPEDPPQMGTSNRPELFEARFWSCVYRDGSLWAVHHQGGSRVRARWYEFRMNGWPSGGTPELVQSGEIDPGGTVRTFFPSIWVDTLGNAAITTARSSPTEFISMSRAVRLAGDPPGEFQPIEFVKESSSAYTIGRWGDYSGTASDPSAPGTFWGHHEYTPGGNSWNTWIARYVLDVPCVEDLDGSGSVDFGDVLAILAVWGPCGGCPEDLDGSGAADFGDILLVLAVWGPC